MEAYAKINELSVPLRASRYQEHPLAQGLPFQK